MTAVQDRPRADAGTRRRVERPKPSRTARLRVAVRIARRQVRRTWVSSLLIMALIALPIAGMAGVAVYVNSMIATPEERMDVSLGQMAGRLVPMAEPGSGFWQAPYDLSESGVGDDWGGVGAEADVLPTDPRSALPAGATAVPVSSGRERIETVDGIAAVSAWAGNVADPRFAGRFELIDGRPPQSAREVIVTRATLTRVGTSVGGSLTVVDDATSYTITGTIDVAELSDAESALAFADADRYPLPSWFVPEPVLDLAAVDALNDAGFGVESRQLVLDPPPFSPPVDMSDYVVPTAAAIEEQSRMSLALGLGAGGVAAGYMVVMLAGAAFAVSARRQQRALAIAASVGAEPRDLRRIVLLQGTVLGLIAGGVGLAAGAGIAALVMRLTDNGSATQFWGFHVPWPLLGGILVFSVLVGSASAWMPARNVGKSDTIGALRGARRPARVSASRPLWGSLLILVGVAITIVCGIAAGAVSVSETIPYDSPLRWLPTVGIIVGPILAQIGIIVSGRWLLWVASRLLSRWGIAARMASRDAVANGARTVPAFAAIGATVFVGVFATAMGMMSSGSQERSYAYGAPLGTVMATVSVLSMNAESAERQDAGTTAVVESLETAGATATAVVRLQTGGGYVEDVADIPEDSLHAMVVAPERVLLSSDEAYYSYFGDPSNNLVVIAEQDIATVTGVVLTPAQARAYADGAVLTTDDRFVTDGRVDVGAWTARDFYEGNIPSNIWSDEQRDLAAPVWERALPAITVSAPAQGVTAAISPETAKVWGLDVAPSQIFATFPAGSEMESDDRLYALAEALSTNDYDVSLWRETGPPNPAVWLVPLLAAVAVLVLGASAVALGLARFERRPDDATLAAVGGTPGLRRRIGLWQGLVIAGFGTFAGAAAGILPPIGFWLQSQTGYEPMNLADIPWWLLAALAVALPLGIAAVNWLVPPREPELTRRNVIA